jgi:hypothetical protein
MMMMMMMLLLVQHLLPGRLSPSLSSTQLLEQVACRAQQASP